MKEKLVVYFRTDYGYCSQLFRFLEVCPLGIPKPVPIGALNWCQYHLPGFHPSSILAVNLIPTDVFKYSWLLLSDRAPISGQRGHSMLTDC